MILVNSRSTHSECTVLLSVQVVGHEEQAEVAGDEETLSVPVEVSCQSLCTNNMPS